MSTNRLEAFSDGVLAIIITIMVLELKVPEGHDLHALRQATGTGLLTYLLSFVYIGIYWNNHHHMFQLVQRVTGGVMWANLHLLFWLSLLPFTTAWLDESSFARTPTVLYGMNLLAAGTAYFILQTVLVRGQGADGPLARAIGSDLKGKLSPALYVTGIGIAAVGDDDHRVWTWIAMAVLVSVAILWLIPDRRIERAVAATDDRETAVG